MQESKIHVKSESIIFILFFEIWIYAKFFY